MFLQNNVLLMILFSSFSSHTLLVPLDDGVLGEEKDDIMHCKINICIEEGLKRGSSISYSTILKNVSINHVRKLAT